MGKANNFPHNHNDRGSLSALILLTIGVVLLLNNFGFISWDIWVILWRFWPVFLIFWGFKELSGNSTLLNLIFGLLGLAIIAFAVAYSLAMTNSEFRLWLESNYPMWGKILQTGSENFNKIDTI